MLFLPETALCNNVLCFTSSTNGGVSSGSYQSFNLANHVGDSKHRVDTNRQLLNAILEQQLRNRGIKDVNIAPIKWLNQQHTTIVKSYLDVNEETQSEGIDGIISDEPLVPLAVMTADCLPIVIACKDSGKISAIHVGWRGLLMHIIANTLTHFDSASSLSVWIGPAISAKHFQISESLLPEFAEYKTAIRADTQKGKYLVDLSAIAKQQLLTLGVSDIQSSDVCTYQNTLCFSHRRNTHMQKKGSINKQTGRMATVILRVS